MRYKAVIFDLDGTILDTLEDLTDATNAALKQNHYPERSIDEVRSFVGNGIRLLIERAVPIGLTASEVDRVFEDFKTYYGEHCSDKTKPYDGIPELLQTLKKEGCKIAVVSNKADRAVQVLCRQYFKDQFDFAVGEREGIQKKPAPDSVNETLRIFRLNAGDAVYVGDSEVDIQTAENAHMDSIIVDWGFRERAFLVKSGAACMVSSPTELLSELGSERT
ncbi:MAG: HAD-IA family hydrolase [Hespellia sp.]|nr:HAD-IA family hydrolase [Hespellia sp.]